MNERDREAREVLSRLSGLRWDRVHHMAEALATARAEGFAAGVAERERDDVVARIAEWSRRFPFIVENRADPDGPMIPLADAISAGYWRQS